NADPALDGMVKAQQYKNFMRTLPDYVSSAHVFIQAGSEDWDAAGFGVTKEMARLVLGQPDPGSTPYDPYNHPENDTEGGTPVNDADRNRLWVDYMAFPAFERFRADHPELGDALEPRERDYGSYRVKFFAGGVAYCKIGDWANIAIAKSKEDLPSPL
ncbi:MAG: hypothetical protein Q7O66_13740, partial [Dehalococcoidia bacterium]|nr:hypothetical protein [Dehalococcoidia bacterium]